MSMGETAECESGQVADRIARRVRLACDAFGQDKITLAIPAMLGDSDIESLLAMPEVASIVIDCEGDALAIRFPGRVGWFYKEQRRWHLPETVTSDILYFGASRELSLMIGPQALRRGVSGVIHETAFGWSRANIVSLMTQRLIRILIVELISSPARQFKSIKNPLIRALLLPSIIVCRWVFRKFHYVFQQICVRRFESTIKSIAANRQVPLLHKADFVPGRVLLVNSALAWGGAERQLVNTAVGLVARGFHDLKVLCDSSATVPDHDFFLWRLQAAGVEVRNLKREVRRPGADSHTKSLDKKLKGLTCLGSSLGEDVAFFVWAFLDIRPEVVHAWQDQTSIKAGIAAMIVGIPKIVLSGRNMAPYHFQYSLPYMRGAYQALLCNNGVQFLNNSQAGADDYAAWLNLPSDRIRVIHNGFDEESLARPDEKSRLSYRKRLGLPNGVRVVGSIFRLYEEKDPMLWVQAAALICKARQDVVFLLIGTGVLQTATTDLAKSLGIADRVFMPGTEKNPALAYDLMDVFLLTSRYEGLPNVILEAQSLGVPVVATDAGGSREAVLEGITGFILEERDAAKLAERVLFVLDNSAWLDEARRLAPDFVHERFGMERMIQETLDVYGLHESRLRRGLKAGD